MKKLLYMLFLGIAIGIYAMKIVEYENIIRVQNKEVIMKIIIKEEFINVRRHPNVNADLIHKVYKNEVYEVIEKLEADYEWYKIKFSDKRTGWIASDDWVIEVEK